MNSVIETIKRRRSVRSFAPATLEQDKLDQIIEAGLWAPSAHNQQSWHLTVVTRRDLLNKLNVITKKHMAVSGIEWIEKMAKNPDMDITYGAPVLVFVAGKRDAIAPSADTSALIQNMLLAAESLDIGSVWLGLTRFLFQEEGVAAELGIPEGYDCHYAVALGYRSETAKTVAPKRREDTVQYIR